MSSTPSATAGTDELSAGFFAHLHTRDTSYAMVSRAPLAKLERWKAEKGWRLDHLHDQALCGPKGAGERSSPT